MKHKLSWGSMRFWKQVKLINTVWESSSNSLYSWLLPMSWTPAEEMPLTSVPLECKVRISEKKILDPEIKSYNWILEKVPSNLDFILDKLLRSLSSSILNCFISASWLACLVSQALFFSSSKFISSCKHYISVVKFMITKKEIKEKVEV